VEWLGKSWDGIDESQPERLAPDWENQRGETSGMVRMMNKIMFSRSISKYQSAPNYLA